MNKNYKKILKSASKKKSALEALFNVTWTEFGFCTLLLVGFCGLSCLNYFWVRTWDCEIIKSNIDYIFIGILLTIFEIPALFLLYILFESAIEYLYIDIPLMLNRRYIPFTEEEIKKLPFKTDSEFIDFIKSLCCKKNIFKNDVYARSNNLFKDITIMFTTYIKIKSADEWEFLNNKIAILENMPKDLYEYFKEKDIEYLYHFEAYSIENNGWFLKELYDLRNELQKEKSNC